VVSVARIRFWLIHSISVMNSISIVGSALLLSCSVDNRIKGSIGSGFNDFSQSEIFFSGPGVADGETPLYILVRLVNSNGKPIKGFRPEYSILSGFGVVSGPCTQSDYNGIAACAVKAMVAGTKTLRVTNIILVLPLQADLEFVAVSNNLTVEPVYPNHSNWLDYVKNNNGGSNAYNQPDASCDGSEVGSFSACIHGGEKRKVAVSALSSCSGLTISDSLGIFDWTCKEELGIVNFYSIGLRSGKGLHDLIGTSYSWNTNSVTVTMDSTVIGTSQESAWWTNSVSALPDNSSGSIINLDGTDDDGAGPDQAFVAGSILVLNSSRNTAGYNINQDKMAVLIKEGATLKLVSDGLCDYGTGEASGGSEVCLLASGSQNFLWVEGAFDGNLYTTNAIQISLTNFSQFRHIKLTNFLEVGLAFASSNRNYVKDISLWDNNTTTGDGALELVGSVDNRFMGIKISDTEGLHIMNSSDRNVFYDMQITNSQWNNILINDSDNNILVTVLSAQSQNAGIFFEAGATGNTVTHQTYGNESDEAVSLYSANSTTIVQSVVANNGGYGGYLIMNPTSDTLFANIAADSHSAWGVQYIGGSNTRFTYNLLLESSSECDYAVAAPTNPGLSTSCANQDGSDSHLVTGIDVTNSFFGKVTSDSANGSHTSGLRTYASITDWFNFDNLYRLWGPDGSAFPNSDHTSRCLFGVDCRIWDWRLRSTDSMLLNRSGDGVNSNEPFVAGNACPVAINGNYVLTDLSTPAKTFLVNAVEIMDDEIGNENGLCESSESCIYSPNFGAYQGEGDYSQNGTCTFVNGTITDVTMYAYPQNGSL
jgi:hypothetical protein